MHAASYAKINNIYHSGNTDVAIEDSGKLPRPVETYVRTTHQDRQTPADNLGEQLGQETTASIANWLGDG